MVIPGWEAWTTAAVVASVLYALWRNAAGPDVLLMGGALVLTTLRALLRDVAALRAGAPAEALVNPDLAPRLEALARGPLGERAIWIAEEAHEAREALRTFASKPLTFDRLVDTLAGA